MTHEKIILRRAFECTALVIVLVMLAGSVAEFAGASIEAARSKLTSMMDMAESLYSDGVEDEQQLAISAAQSGVRATLIGLDGSVIYDSEASGTIENHAHREEFKRRWRARRAMRSAPARAWAPVGYTVRGASGTAYCA